MATSNTPRIGTGFTNLNRIMEANVGNRLGQTVSKRVSDVGARAGTELESAYRDFQTEAGKYDVEGRTGSQDKSNKEFAEDMYKRVMGTTPNVSIQSTQPTQQDQIPEFTDDEMKRFSRIREGVYQGPRSIQNIDTLRAQAQQAQGLGDLTRTQGGRQELLRQTMGRPGYTQGQRRLDTLLLNQQPLAQARQITQGLGQQAERTGQQAELYAQGLQNRALQYGQALNEQLQKSATGIEEDVQKQLESYQAQEKKRQSELADLQDYLKGQERDLSRAPIDPTTGLPTLSQEDIKLGYKLQKDSNGNTVVLNPQNQIMTKPLGKKNAYAKIDELAQKLKSIGVPEENIKALIGEGNFAKSKETYQSLIDDYIKKRNAAERFWASKDKDKPAIFQEAGIAPTLSDSGETDYTPYIGFKASYKGQQLLNDAAAAARAKLNEQMYGKMGKLGELLSQERSLSGEADTSKMFADLSTLLSNTAPAQGLTPTGAASEIQRQRYQRLNELMGKPYDERFSQKGKTGDIEQYTPGNIWLNPEQIKNLRGV